VVVLPRFSASDVSMRLTLAFPICVLIVNGLILQRSASIRRAARQARLSASGVILAGRQMQELAA
jgi:hypothetical protein